MANPKFNSHPPSIVDLKQQWRQRLKDIRQGLNPQRRQEAAAHACLQLKQWCQSTDLVLSFSSFGSEINLKAFNQQLAKEGRLVLPKMMGEQQLQLFRVTDFSHLELHRWGIFEPKTFGCPSIDISLIKIALIPGLGFDLKNKYRLGYGLGYYDRLLSNTTSTKTWGIGFLEQAIENLPYTTQDIPLNQIHLF